jgi:hypothetical protein
MTYPATNIDVRLWVLDVFQPGPVKRFQGSEAGLQLYNDLATKGSLYP